MSNVSENRLKVDRNSDSRSLNLTDRKSFKISQIYPEKKTVGTYKTIGESFEIQPLETVLYTVE